MKIWFVRHAKTDANLSNKWQGISDIDISNEGYNDLNNNKENFKKYNFDLIISSPLKRAMKTGEFILKNQTDTLNTQFVIDKQIIERNFGQLELQDCDNETKNILADMEKNTDLNLGVEKIKDMYENRIIPFLIKIKKDFKNQNLNILIVAHSWVGRLLKYYSSNNKEDIKKAPKHLELYQIEI